MKSLLLAFLLSLMVFVGCDSDEMVNFNGNGKCHIVFDQTALIVLGSASMVTSHGLVADDNTVMVMDSNCPFFVQSPIHNIPFKVEQINPYETYLGPYLFSGELLASAPNRFAYEQELAEMEAPLNKNCKIKGNAEGEIEVEGLYANFEGTVELWLEWSSNGPPCLDWHLF